MDEFIVENIPFGSMELYWKQKAQNYEEAIRKHRDQRGDDRCWRDDFNLYKTLPEGYDEPPEDTEVQIENCLRYIKSRKCPATAYVSPQRKIEELEKIMQPWNKWISYGNGVHCV